MADTRNTRHLVDPEIAPVIDSYPGAIHAFNMMAEAAIAKAFNRDLLGGIARLLRI